VSAFAPKAILLMAFDVALAGMLPKYIDPFKTKASDKPLIFVAPLEAVLTALATNAVVATLVVLSPAVGVGARGVPVNVGLASGAFKSNAVWVAVETGLLASEVLFTLPKPTIVGVTPDTVPVNVGEAMFAFKSNAADTLAVAALILLAFVAMLVALLDI